MSIGSGVNRLRRILVCLVAVIGGAGPFSDTRGYAETVDPERRSCFSEVRACLSEFIHDPNTRFGSEGLQAAEIQHLWLAYGVLGSALATLEFVAEPPRNARWDGENGFDEGIRSGLKGRSRSARKAAGIASDVFLKGVMPLATLTDMLCLRSEYPFLKRVLFDGSWLLTNELTTRTAKVAAGRERPYVDPCQGDSDYVGSCDKGRDSNASFFSGHASTTATMAGLICSRHLNRTATDFYDWLVCGGVVASSVTTGLLRITSENHNATDVLAGWASGAIFGYVLPSHFQKRYSRTTADTGASIEPVASPRFLGLRLAYAF